jgi:hypothetical protein
VFTEEHQFFFIERVYMISSKIREYFSTRELACEDDVSRNEVIEQPIEIYKRITQKMDEPEEYLNSMNNDLVKLIGYRIDLENKKDHYGLSLWDELDQRMYEDTVVSEKRVIEVLHEVPMFFLMSFLGYACYKEKQWDL